MKTKNKKRNVNGCYSNWGQKLTGSDKLHFGTYFNYALNCIYQKRSSLKLYLLHMFDLPPPYLKSNYILQ